MVAPLSICCALQISYVAGCMEACVLHAWCFNCEWSYVIRSTPYLFFCIPTQWRASCNVLQDIWSFLSTLCLSSLPVTSLSWSSSNRYQAIVSIPLALTVQFHDIYIPKTAIRCSCPRSAETFPPSNTLWSIWRWSELTLQLTVQGGIYTHQARHSYFSGPLLWLYFPNSLVGVGFSEV